MTAPHQPVLLAAAAVALVLREVRHAEPQRLATAVGPIMPPRRFRRAVAALVKAHVATVKRGELWWCGGERRAK